MSKKESVNIRVDSVTKEDFAYVCKTLGLNVSTALRNFMQGVNHLQLKEATALFSKLEEWGKEEETEISTRSM